LSSVLSELHLETNSLICFFQLFSYLGMDRVDIAVEKEKRRHYQFRLQFLSHDYQLGIRYVGARQGDKINHQQLSLCHLGSTAD
jgi:hypothetical protein